MRFENICGLDLLLKMSIKDSLLSLFSRAPSKNKGSDWDGDFFIDKRPPE
jgi:hypothetical protein